MTQKRNRQGKGENRSPTLEKEGKASSSKHPRYKMNGKTGVPGEKTH